MRMEVSLLDQTVTQYEMWTDQALFFLEFPYDLFDCLNKMAIELVGDIAGVRSNEHFVSHSKVYACT